MTLDISEKQLLDKICFIKWKNAVQAINDCINKELDDFNETIENRKDKCIREIIPQISDFKPRIGMELTLEEFERYVELHKHLRDTMQDIRCNCTKIHDAISDTLTDSVKLIDEISPLYSKFTMPSREANEEKSSIFIMVFVTLLFLSSIIVAAYLISEKEELDVISKYLKAYKVLI